MRTWLAALLAAAVALGALERFWRVRGYQPTVRDRPELWALWRDRANNDPRALVLIGSSRFQTGVDPELLGRELPGRHVSLLAISGASPLPVLAELAQDESFRGSVVCEVHPATMFRSNEPARQAAQAFLNSRRHGSWVGGVEARLRSAAQDRLVLMRGELTPTALLREWMASRRLPPRPCTRSRPDRFMMADYSAIDRPKAEERWIEGIRSGPEGYDAAQLEQAIATVNDAVERIRARGGSVLFFRMNSSGALYAAEEERLPRARYWDLFARRVKAPALHFKDVPALARIECPEGSHLDFRDAGAFARGFAAELKKQMPLDRQ